MNQPVSEGELIAKAVSGDHQALEALLLSHHDRLLAHINRLIPAKVRASVAAEDVLQQTYVKVFNSIGRFEPQGDGSFYGWLRVIATRQLMDACRRRDREHLTVQSPHSPAGQNPRSSFHGLLSVVIGDEPVPSQQAMRQELQGAYQLALARMPEDYRQALTLRYVEGRSLEEVAQALGISEGAVRGLCHRAKQRLRSEISRLSLFV